jgi:hypothetical protein
VVRHAKGIMALAVVAAVVVAAVLSGSSSTDTSPAANDAAAPSVTVPVAQSPSPSAPAPKAKAQPKRRAVVATGANGQRYRCPPSVLGRVDAARERFRGPERALNGMQAALKKLDKKYPGRTAPPATAQRYNALLARARAQVTTTNEAIGRYNQTLRDACHKE